VAVGVRLGNWFGMHLVNQSLSKIMHCRTLDKLCFKAVPFMLRCFVGVCCWFAGVFYLRLAVSCCSGLGG
jgi:hypothetical protein